MPVVDLLPKLRACDGYLRIAVEFLGATLGLLLMPRLQWKRLTGVGNVFPELLHDSKLIGDRQFSQFFQFDGHRIISFPALTVR